MKRRQGRKGPTEAITLLMLLGRQVARLPQKPPVTLTLMAAMVWLYLQPGTEGVPDIGQGCLLPSAVLEASLLL